MRKIDSKKFGDSFYYVLDALIEKVEIDKDWFSDNEEQTEWINNKINFLKQTKEYAQKGLLPISEVLRVFSQI